MRRIVHPPIAQTAATSSPSAKADGVSAHAVRTACGLAALLIAASRAAAGGLDFPIAEDTHIDSRISNGAENWNFGADHTDKVVVNGQDDPTSLCRALFRLPADLWLYAPSQIISAKVMFYVWQDNSGDRGVSLFPLTTDFVQGSGSKYGQPDPVDGATWWTCDGSNAWTTPGGDFDANFPIPGVKEDILDESAHDRFFHWDVTGLLTNAAARTNLQAHGALLMIDEEPVPATGMPRAPFTSSDDLGYAPAYRPHLDLQVILRTPAAPQIVVSNGVVTMDLAGCTPYVTNRIERTFDLAQTNGWTWVADLVTTGAATNWAETLPAEATNAFYRVKIAE